MSVISLLYDGYQIIQDVVLADAEFMCQADGRPGTCHFRVKDAGNIDAGHYGFPSNRVPQGTFHTGLTIELRIDDILVWSGATQSVGHMYAFDAENTSTPGTRQRFWVIDGVDWNILFTKRVVWNVANPTERIPGFTGTENDGDVVKLIMSQYLDLSGDGISDAGVMTIGPLSPYGEPFNVASPGDTWGESMDRITAANGGIYYIDPDKVLQFRDDEIVTAPFPLTDQPALIDQGVGYRDMVVSSSAMEMANDALVWGAGQGASVPVFARVEDATSIADHGRFQWGDFRSDMWVQATVERRAESYVYGSPTNLRGHKDDHDTIGVTIFQPFFRVGQVVDFRNNTFGYQDNVPIRQMRITFPTPTDAMFALQLSHNIDLPFFFADPLPPYPTPPPIDDVWITEIIPLPVITPGFGEEDSGDAVLLENVVQDLNSFISRNEDGQFVGSGGGVYSSVGIKNGFVANIPYTEATCGGIGPGAYNKYEDREQWTRLIDGDALPDFPYGVQRTWIVDNHIDYEVSLGTKSIQGYVPSLTVRVAYGDPAAGRFGDGTVIGSVAVSAPNPPEPMSSSNRSVALGSVVIPSSMFASTEHMYLVIAPGWECERGGYYCDPVYWGGPAVCIAQGPRCTGEGASGVVSLTQFTPSSSAIQPHRSNIDGGVVFIESTGQTTFYRTQYPYVTGTLKVTLQGTTLNDVQETDPATGTFSLPTEIRDQTEYISVTYQRADIAVTPPPDMGTPPREPGTDYTLPPSVPGGQTYRPANQRQGGWGTVFDGVNCVFASSAMALDRHTMGRNTAFRGSPLSTPPAHRYYSGDTSGGASYGAAQHAWSVGWGETLLQPGPVSWSYFVSQVQSGRGALLGGQYRFMPEPYNHAANYAAGHSLYINEQLSDGSFWGFDPIVGYPIIYPYDVLRTYAESTLGFSGLVQSAYTRVTPKI